MKKKDTLTEFYQNISQLLQKIDDKDNFAKVFYQSFLAGTRKVYQKYLSETKHFEADWVETLESYFPSIDKIIHDPISYLRYEEDIIPIEKARKVTSKSIRHLAANTHLIKEVRNDQVVPKKILTSFSEVDYGTYENRFIMTLIDRLWGFVSNRYEVIESNVESFQRNHFNLNSFFTINKTKVHMDIDLVIQEDLDNPNVNIQNQILLNRVTHLRSLVGNFKSSPFMKTMSEFKPVKPPIAKTNVLLKNPDFRNAYNLWLFLDTHNTLWFDIDVEEKNLNFDNEYIQDINRLAMMVFGFIQKNQKMREPIYEFLDTNYYKSKSTRIAKIHSSDVVRNPDGIIMEDYSAVEFYLTKILSAFEENLDNLLKEDILPETALRRALRQTINVSNSLYSAAFNFDEDENDDVFNRLVNSPDIEKMLDKAKEKARIAKIVRETKEVDYKEAIRLEKRMMKEIEKYNSKLIKVISDEEVKQKKKELKEKLIQERKQEKEDAKRIQAEMTEQLKRIVKEKQGVLREHKSLYKRMQTASNRIKETAKVKWAKEKEQMLAKERIVREAMREKEEKKRAKQYAKAKKLIERSNSELKKWVINKRMVQNEEDDKNN